MSDSVRDGVGELTNRVVHGRWVNIVDCRCNLVPVMDRTARLLALHNKLVADVGVTVTVMCKGVLECLIMCKSVREWLIMCKSVLECLIMCKGVQERVGKEVGGAAGGDLPLACRLHHHTA